MCYKSQVNSIIKEGNKSTTESVMSTWKLTMTVLLFRVNLKCPPMLEDEVLVDIGRKYNKNSAQVALRFNVQRGVVVIPKSFTGQRIDENFQVGQSDSVISQKV